MAKKKTLKSSSLPEPQSRNEALLQNILGADYDLGEPRSRNEALLMQIAEKIGQLSEPYTAGQYININDKEISSTLHAGENIDIDEDGAINADSQLPAVTAADDGKVLKVENGGWVAGEAGGGSKTKIFSVGVSIGTDGTSVTSLKFLLPYSGTDTFKTIYDLVNAGEDVIMRFFDCRGNENTFDVNSGVVFVTEMTITNRYVLFPSINGIFRVKSTVSGDNNYYWVALAYRNINASLNMNSKSFSVDYPSNMCKILA